MQHRLEIENLQCYGCVEAVELAVAFVPGVSRVAVDLANRTVWFDGPAELVPRIVRVLSRLGFPIAGTVDAVELVLASVRAVGSCELGRRIGHHGTPLMTQPVCPPKPVAAQATPFDPDEVVVLDDGSSRDD